MTSELSLPQSIAKAGAVFGRAFRRLFRFPEATEGATASGELLGEIALLSPDDVLQRLGVSAGGPTADEAGARLHSVGPNQVARKQRQTVLGELVGRSINPLNALLLTLATASYFIGDQKAAILIAAMVFLSVSLGFVQEHRSNQAAEALSLWKRPLSRSFPATSFCSQRVI